MKEYYYLDGLEKKGPFTEQELINLNLSSETLIWTEGYENWTALKDFPDLLKIIPPSLPKAFESEIKKKKVSKRISYSLLSLFFLLFLSWIISSYIISSRKKEYKQEIYARVERIFNNKLIVCSGVNYKVEGELKRVQKPTKSNRSSYLDSDKLQYEDDLKKNIVEKFYYNLGGFNYKKLKKIENGYELEHISSRDLDYKSLNRYRPSIQDAYNKAYDFILKKNAGCHLPGIYDIISNFEYLHNNYYEIRNVAKPSRPFLKPKQRWENYFDYGSQILHYVTYSGYYEITERYSMIKEDYIKLYSLTGGLSFLIFTLLLSINPLKW